MAYASSGGVQIYFEETGAGTPILFVHEFGGDHRSWEAQVRHFSRGHRCVVMSARGYPPSDVPDNDADYSQAHFNRDAIAVLDHLKIAKAHLVGLSMGGYAVLMVGGTYPDRALSVVAAGAGSGSQKASRDQFKKDAIARSRAMEASGRFDAGETGLSPTRVQLLVKDPRGWEEFVQNLSEHSAEGSARTLRGVQAARPSLYDCGRVLDAIAVPLLLLCGDEDEPCIDINVWMKRRLANAELAFLPRAGHAINLEEPALFNQLTETFLTKVENGSWKPRDPRAVPGEAFGMPPSKRPEMRPLKGRRTSHTKDEA